MTAGRILAALCVAVALAGAPSHGRANSPDLFGLGSRAIALGGAYTAVADDYSATYYNPAGLTQLRSTELTLAPVFSTFDVWTKDPGTARAPADLPDASGLVFGFAAPLGKLFGLDDLWLGVSLYMPAEFVVGAVVPPRPDTRYFPLLTDAPGRISVAAALAYRIHEVLSVGIGIDIFMDLGGYSVVALSPREHAWEAREEVQVDIFRDLAYEPALTAGILVRPIEWLRVGLSYRMEERLDTVLDPNDFILGAVLEADLKLHFVNFFRPHQLTLGLCFEPHEMVLASVDVGYHFWSAYADPHGEQPDPAWSDTVVPRLGVELRPLAGLAVELGYFYQPTPVPDQVAESNLQDSDRHALSFGLVWDFRARTDSARLPLTIAFHMQLQLLDSRDTVKDLARLPDSDREAPGKQVLNAGYPRYSHGGHILSGGVSLSVHVE